MGVRWWETDKAKHTMVCPKCGWTTTGTRNKVLRKMSKHRRQVHGGK